MENGRRMAPIKVQDAARHLMWHFRKKSGDTAHLAVAGEEGDVLHFLHGGCRSHKGERHFPVRPWRPFVQKEINLVSLRRIFIFLPGSENGKTSIDTLGALSTVRMKYRHLVHTGATPRMRNQIAAPVRSNTVNYLGLGLPDERIAHVDGSVKRFGKYAMEPRQNLRMRGPSRPSADDLVDRRQVETDNTILEEQYAIEIEESGRHSAKRREQEGSGSDALCSRLRSLSKFAQTGMWSTRPTPTRTRAGR